MKRLYYSIKAMTPLHVGVGTGLGHIDLPIQREVHTKFPMIPGTAVKGALREYHLRSLVTSELNISELDKKLQECSDIDVNGLIEKFGCKNKAGNLAFSDLRILLFPVKSLNGIFAYITSPAVLMRLAEDIGVNAPGISLSSDSKAIVFGNTVKVNDNLVVLEEFTFEISNDNGSLKKWLKEAFEKLGIDLDEISERLVILSDNAFNDFVQNYTEVQTHVKIDPSTGTVQSGALWTEEYLPAETFMYGIIFEVRNNKSEDTDLTKDLLPDYLHLGGDITTGKGFVRIYEGEKEG